MGRGVNRLALTGIPRGGTTLACRLLSHCPNTLALAEPLSMRALPVPQDAAIAAVLAAFDAIHHRLLTEGHAPATVVNGGIGDNFFGEDGEGVRTRRAWAGQVRPQTVWRHGNLLAIKQNAGFLALLPDLAPRLPVVAIIRHPLPVLASWQTVDLPVRDGRLPAGEHFDPALRTRLDGVPDAAARQLIVLDWCFSRIAMLSPERIVRYESMVASGGESLYRACGVAGTTQPLQDRNASPLYRACDPHQLAARLRNFGGAWTRFYPAGTDAGVLAALQGGA